MSLKVKSNGINFNVPTIENLPTERLEEDLVCVVTDENRGGVFVYREANALVNNGGTIFSGWTRQYDGAVNVKWFGAKGDGVTDDTVAIQNTINFNTSVYIPKGTFIVQSSLYLPSGATVFGEKRIDTILKCTSEHTSGVVVINGTGRVSISDLYVLTNSKYGILLDTANDTLYPFQFNLQRVQVVSTALGEVGTSTLAQIRAGACGIKILGASHVQMDTVNVSGKNIACDISAISFNTGVMTFNNCLFGNKEEDLIGLSIGSGNALDAYVFNGCFFAGTLAAECLGTGTNIIVGLTHNACHYESKGALTNSSLVRIEGGSGVGLTSSSWNQCVFGGHGVTQYGVLFSNTGYFYGLSFIAPTFQNIKSTGIAMEMGTSTLFKDCVVTSLRRTTTQPVMFGNEARMFNESGAWFGGWSVINDGVYDVKNALEVGNHCRISSKPNDAQFYHSYTKGDIFINEAVTDVGAYGNVGWVATGSGGAEVMKPFGLIREKPATTFPTTGTYSRGAIVYNTLPSAGGYIGWVCTAAGTPGTWKGFGLIQS